VEKVGTPGVPLSTSGAGAPSETSNVDLATEMVNTMTAQKGYIANLNTIKTQEEILDALLDILA